MTHDFNERLSMSERASDEPFWDSIYRSAFPDLINHMTTTGNTQSQRLGIDRILHLSSGRTLYIDEKKRESVYSDILLEYLSVDTTGAPGWIEKPLHIDYLAYAFMPTRCAYLFPWHVLQRAWRVNKQRWMSAYKPVVAQNNGYRTHSLPIPIAVLQNAVKDAFLVQLPPAKTDWLEQPHFNVVLKLRSALGLPPTKSFYVAELLGQLGDRATPHMSLEQLSRLVRPMVNFGDAPSKSASVGEIPF